MSRTITTLATLPAVLVLTAAVAGGDAHPRTEERHDPDHRGDLVDLLGHPGVAAQRAPLAQPSAVLTGVRSGQHGCYDRLVIDLRGPIVGYDVRCRHRACRRQRHADPASAVEPVSPSSFSYRHTILLASRHSAQSTPRS